MRLSEYSKLKVIRMVESTETAYRMEGVAFGLADGTICFLGLTIGVAEATSDPTLVIISGIIGGIANAFGNSIGFFISQSTERGVQIHETEEHGVKTRIHSKREVLMSGVLTFLATILALAVLISPFLFFNIPTAILVTFSFGMILAFILGSYVGKLSRENPYKTGLKYVGLGIVGAVISFFIGDFLKHLLIEQTIRIF
jgi:predicted membrane protein (TIGR00267 family)